MLSKKLHIPVDHVDISGHMTSKKLYIPISTRSLATKLDGMVAYDKEPQT